MEDGGVPIASRQFASLSRLAGCTCSSYTTAQTCAWLARVVSFCSLWQCFQPKWPTAQILCAAVTSSWTRCRTSRPDDIWIPGHLASFARAPRLALAWSSSRDPLHLSGSRVPPTPKPKPSGRLIEHKTLELLGHSVSCNHSAFRTWPYLDACLCLYNTLLGLPS